MNKEEIKKLIDKLERDIKSLASDLQYVKNKITIDQLKYAISIRQVKLKSLEADLKRQCCEKCGNVINL